MDPAYLDYLLIATGTLTLSTLGFAIAWVRARERAIRAEQSPERVAAGIDARFERLEQFAEGTAFEVERVAEVQRLQGSLLAERASEPGSVGRAPAARSQLAPGRVDTPH